MSWLGDHLSSFTEKITDFTKEVLIDDSKIDTDNQNSTLSYKELLDLCEYKDAKIKNLITEKEYLEKSIDELDQQHQEAVEALLIQKNQVIAENNDIKKKLSKEFKPENSRADFPLLYSNSDLSHDIKLSASEPQYLELFEGNINLISILQSVSDSSEDEKFKKQIDWLEKQKTHITTGERDENDVANKIDNYINFLDALHNQSLYSVVDEICSIFNSILCENSQLKKNAKFTSSITNSSSCCHNESINVTSGQSNERKSSLSESNSKIINTSTQTDIDAVKCFSNSNTQTIDSSPIKSIHQQYKTDDISEYEQLRNNSLLEKFKTNIQQLEQEKFQLQQSVNHLKLSTDKKTNVAIIQTDDNVKQLELELSSSQQTVQNLTANYNSLENKFTSVVKELNEELDSRDSIISLQKSQINMFNENIISLKDTIKILQQDLKTNHDKNESIKHLVNMPVQSANDSESISKSEFTLLQEKLKTSELEKGKLLCVLNEKTQECSSLKAEVHKLTNIVSSEKQALFKLQQDNCDLKQLNSEKSDPELTKETVKRLSTLIKDKDLEIDSLKQKNSTLTTLIQSTMTVPEHLQGLMIEKESLSKQLQDFKAEREKIMLKFNAKDKDWRASNQEVKRLTELLNNQKQEYDNLEQSHGTVAQQYEEKQKSLINAQNEIVTLKQRISDLQQQLVDLKNKYSELLNTVNSDTTIQITKNELNEKNHKIEKLTCTNEEKDHLIQEKDCMIHDLAQQVKKLKLESEQHLQLNEELQDKTVANSNKFKEAEITIEQLQKDKNLLEQRFQDKCSELDLLKEINERLNMTVKEKEFAIQSMTEKISSLSQYIGNEPSSPGSADINQILADSESMFSEAQKFRRERDETLLALNQSKQDNQSLRNEIQRMKSTEIHLESQLARLRQHLLEVEENNTNEALKAEEREKKLQEELLEVKRRADITSTAVVDTNQRASIQIASLQEQLAIVANQRDEALTQVSSLEDKVLQHSTAVNKLQLVLEQIQKSNERKIKEAENKWQIKLEKQKETIKQIEKQLQIKEMQLEESSRALEAASRLSEQLDAKEEIILNLKSELFKTENKIKSTALEINSIKSNTEGKVDRIVMKSLVLGYFSTPPGQKSEVIRLLARVLDFNQEEMEKAGIVVGRSTKKVESRGIFSSIFNRLPSLGPAEHNVQQAEKSFTTLFVQFLENESQPIVPMPFPAEKMVQELTSKTHPNKNKKSQSASNDSSPRRSPLLMDIDSAFPTFKPLPALDYSISPAPSILKEVLE